MYMLGVTSNIIKSVCKTTSMQYAEMFHKQQERARLVFLLPHIANRELLLHSSLIPP